MVFMASASTDARQSPAGIELSSFCPPSFAKVGNACRLQSQYLQYASLQSAGVGGLKTGLPKFRDGFSPQQIDLGRYLFFDPALSADNSTSCASCHVPELGFSDGLARSKGIGNQEAARNAPSLWNVAFLNRFFWDGRAATLEAQMQGPLYDAHEMGNTREAMLRKIERTARIPTTVRHCLSGLEIRTSAGAHLQRIDRLRDIAGIAEQPLRSLCARVPRGAHPEGSSRDMNVFRSFVARCSECHTPPLFTNQQIAVIGTPEPKGRAFDAGAGKTSNEPTLRGGFKVPSLRNVALTAPYEHSGQFQTLRSAVEFYNLGRGHAVPKGEKLTLHWHIWEPNLSAAEIDRVVDFLGALTDESFRPERPRMLPSGLKPSPLAATNNSKKPSMKDSP